MICRADHPAGVTKRWHARCMGRRVLQHVERDLRAYLRDWLVWSVGLAVLWLLLTDTPTALEIAVGVGAAVIAAGGATLTRARDRIEYRFRPGWLLLLARKVPLQTAADCLLVLREVVLCLVSRERVHGHVISYPFDPGPEKSPQAAGRRALVEVAVSVAPNAYVVDVRPEAHELLVHQLVPAGTQPSDPEWPL
jgi:hypothetical protein